MIVAVPGNNPATMPATGSIVAIVVLLLLHDPPLVPSDRIDVVPAHILNVPVITVGAGLTVTVTEAGQWADRL